MTTAAPTTIAVLGLGAMGSRMAAKLLDAGHHLRVWNRSTQAAAALAARGGTPAQTIREACEGADTIIAMVRDDDASRAVWLADSGAFASAKPDTLAIDCSTLTPPCTRELADHAAKHALRFVASPVLGSRPHAEAGQLIALLGGATDDVEHAKSTIAAFAPKTFNMGDAPQAASAKLAVNAFFATQLAAAGELITYLRALGINDNAWQQLFADIPVVAPAIAGAMKGMAGANFAPMFPIDLVHKDLGCFTESANQNGVGSEVIEFIRSLYARAIDAGHGNDNITGIQQIFS